MKGSEAGLLILILLMLLLAVWLQSCATFEQTCRYEGGKLVEQSTESTILGTGETELATEACALLSYTTQDTGLSDNAKGALGTVAEGAAAGVTPWRLP